MADVPHFRTGRKVGRTIYIQRGHEPSDGDELVGMMDDRELASLVVDALNDHGQRISRGKYGPRKEDSPESECPACHEPFVAGDVTTLVALGPGADPEARERAAAGRAYNAIALEAHWACVHGDEQ